MSIILAIEAIANQFLVVDSPEAALTFRSVVLFFRLAVRMMRETMFLPLLTQVSLVMRGRLLIKN